MRTILVGMIATAVLAAPAIATEDAVVAYGAQREAVRVQVGDLDLGSPAGLATLDGRVARAINRVCGMPVPSDPVPTVTASCRAEARAVADRQIAALGASAATGAGAISVGGSR